MKRDAKTKPFPWRCPRCLERAVRPTTITYIARRTHDGQLDTVEIPALKIPRCEKCGELLFTQRVDEQIQDAFRTRRAIEAEIT